MTKNWIPSKISCWKAANKGQGGGWGVYVVDDRDRLRNVGTQTGRSPCSMLALIHSTYGNPRMSRMMERLIQNPYLTTPSGDIHEWVPSCGCRMRKRSVSQRVAMLSAKALRPWEVPEIGAQDMRVTSRAGTTHVLVVMDKTSKFPCAEPCHHRRHGG